MKQVSLLLSLFLCVCFTAKATDEYVEIKTPSMIEYLKVRHEILPNKDGLYSMDSLSRVRSYLVRELPLPAEFKYLRNLREVRVFTKNDDNILDFSPFEDIFKEFLQITSYVKVKITMGKQDSLKHLFIYSKCVGLDIKECVSLERLFCYKNNEIDTLDLSCNLSLKHLDCGNNKLTSLDLSNNLYLEKLICNGNQLKSLDLSKNVRLKELDCSYNKFRSLKDLSLPKSITHFYFFPCDNFRESPQRFYIDSFPNLEILQLGEMQIKVK